MPQGSQRPTTTPGRAAQPGHDPPRAGLSRSQRPPRPGDPIWALYGLLTQERGLYRWPEHGWQRGAVARLCQRGAFSHVVAARRTHCSTPPPTTSVGCCYPLPLVPGSPGPPTRRLPAGPPLWPGPPTLPFSLVGGSSQPGPPAGPGSEVAVEIAISQNVRVCDSLCGLSEAAKDSRCNGPPTRRLRPSALAGPPRP